MTTKTIFISHSTKDDAQVDHISDSLIKVGHTVWVDHRNGITPGTPSWDKAIRDAIKSADVGVFVMTEHALESDICGSECLLIRELNKPLYVLRLQACKPENIFLYIKQIQYADLVTNFEAGIQTFLDVLGGDIAQNLPTPTRAKITGSETMRQYLPFLNNPLRGRDDDLIKIQTMLTQTGITQIIGVGGWGKSRISAEIALAYPQGAVWHRCSSVSSAGDLLYVLRRHFDLPDDIPQDNILVLLDTHRPLVVIDNAEDVAPKSDRRAGYVDLLGKIAGLGVPVLLTSRTVWDELKPRKQYPPPALNGDIAQTITADFAESQNIALTPDQIAELTRASRNHPRLMELAVALLQEALPYERLIKRLNDLSHDDMQDALNEMITKTVDQMRHEAKHGEQAYALLRNLTWLQATFPYEAITALKPAGLSDEDLDDAITTLGRYTFLQHDKNTGRYRLGGLVREALGVNDDEAVFNAYADYYIGRAKAIFVDLPVEEWRKYNDDIINISELGYRLASQPNKGDLDISTRITKFAQYTQEYITHHLELKLWLWIEMGLTAIDVIQDKIQDYRLNIEKANLLNSLGEIYFELGDKHQALNYLYLSLSFTENLNDAYETRIFSLLHLGNTYSDLSEKDKAHIYYQKALELSKLIGNKNQEAKLLNHIGWVLDSLGKKQEAYDYYNHALQIIDYLRNDKNTESLILHNLGRFWRDEKNYQKALSYHQRALAIRESLGDAGKVSISLTSIGFVLMDMDNYEQAIEYFEKALPLRWSVASIGGEALTLTGLGQVWFKQSNYQKALMYFEKALSLFTKVQDSWYIANTYYHIGLTHLNMKLYDEAIKFLEMAIQSTNTQDPKLITYQLELTRLKALRGGGA